MVFSHCNSASLGLRLADSPGDGSEVLELVGVTPFSGATAVVGCPDVFVLSLIASNLDAMRKPQAGQDAGAARAENSQWPNALAQKTKADSEQREPGKNSTIQELFFRGNSTLGIVGGVQAIEQFLGANHFAVTGTRN